MSRILSSLLSTRDHGLLFSLLGQDCSVSACAVVQLLMATADHGGHRSKWKVHSYGVACLVQDKKLHSSFIRLFCLKRAKQLWEQELYTPFEYSAPCPYFHTFPGDDCRTGLNFADEEEAGRFYDEVQKCIKMTKAQPVLMRTPSMDLASGWQLRDKLNTSVSASGKDRRSSSPKTLPPANQKVNQPAVRPVIKPALSPSSFSSSTFPKTQKSASVSLAQRKGPLPPVPTNTNRAPSRGAHTTNQTQLFSSSSIPLPPPYPAPKICPAGVKKSASFAPSGNSSSATPKRQRSLHLTAGMQAGTHYKDGQ